MFTGPIAARGKTSYIESILHTRSSITQLHSSLIELECCIRSTEYQEVEDTTYLHKERYGERCDTSIQVGIEFLGYSVDYLRETCHGARLWRITAQVLQVKNFSKYYRRDLIGV